jgi:hypothetical protein
MSMLQLILALGVSAWPCQDPVPVPAIDAGQFVGRKISVEGQVAAVRVSPRGPLVLDLERPYPNAAISIVVPRSLEKQFSDLGKWRGKRVIARGTVIKNSDHLELTIEVAADLVIAAEPHRIPCG